MSNSSRSITAARARRAGEQVPPMSGNRPVTSIGSHAAFAPQQQYQQQPPPNVRVARGQPPMPPQMQQQMQQQLQQQMHHQQPQQSNGLPFSKLSISDAIGLITLRLGRVEQFIIDCENGEQSIHGSMHESSTSIHEKSTVIDSSVLNNIVSRLDSLEKREPLSTGNAENMLKISDEIDIIKKQFIKLNEDIIKNNLLTSQHNEKLFKLDRDLVETKDLLRSLLFKVDTHIQETNDKFVDYEYAIAEIEKNISLTPSESVLNSENLVFSIEQQEQQEREQQERDQQEEQDNSAILSVDLKNIIKQELANV